MTEPKRVTLTRLDAEGRPVGDPVELGGVVDFHLEDDGPPPLLMWPPVPRFTDEQRAALAASLTELRTGLERFAGNVGVAVAQAAQDAAAALAALRPAHRRGVDAQRSPYGPRGRR